MWFKNLLNKVQNIYVISLASNVILAVLGLVTYAVLSRSLTLEAFGMWVFFTAVVGLLETIRSGFIVTAFIKFYSGTTPERAE